MPDALLLGSASPRRAELLAQLGIPFSVCSADIDETPRRAEPPRDYVSRMAREKGEAISATGVAGHSVLLTADTTVVLDGESLGKPGSSDEAYAMLDSLSGRTHDVLTALSLRARRGSCLRLVETRVEFMALSRDLITAYLATEEPWDKAGAYAIQGVAGSFVRRVEGSVTNVIGLPLVETREILAWGGLQPAVAADAV